MLEGLKHALGHLLAQQEILRIKLQQEQIPLAMMDGFELAVKTVQQLKDIYANEIRLRRDDDKRQWVATYGDFINLQESNAGYGMSPAQAIVDLRYKEPRDA